MSAPTLANSAATRTLPSPAVKAADAAPTITPDLAAILHDVRPHPQLGPTGPAPVGSALLGKAAAAIAASLVGGCWPADGAPDPAAGAAELIALRASYLLPPGTRGRVHRAGPGGVLVLAPSSRARAVAAAGPGLYVVVEALAEN
jgi:hypothetical protein